MNELNVLEPKSIPKFVNELGPWPVFVPEVIDDKTCGKPVHFYNVDMKEVWTQLLPPPFPKTLLWGFGGKVRFNENSQAVYALTSPGPTFVEDRGIKSVVKWNNRILGNYLAPVDTTVLWANPKNIPTSNAYTPFPPGNYIAQSPVPTVIHLHGAEVSSLYDGHPNAWYTETGITGPVYSTNCYEYPNTQQATTLWYHDHTLGLTRISVYSGLNGAYVIRDNNNSFDKPENNCLPTGKYDIPLIIQDRTFYEDGSLYYPTLGTYSEVFPYWNIDFVANTLTVNDKVWPNLKVEKQLYKFRIINVSNERFYNLFLSNGQSFTLIATDGGYIEKPIDLKSIQLAPAERAEILIDFRNLPSGCKIVLRNDAPAPYPGGAIPDPQTVGQVMQFTVEETNKTKQYCIPCRLNKFPKLTPDSKRKIQTLLFSNDFVLLNGQRFYSPPSEFNEVGSTLEWDLVNFNLTAHPIHLHLIQFKIVNRQFINIAQYMYDWLQINSTPPMNAPTQTLEIEKYLIGSPIPPEPYEMGWKDIVVCNPNQVARIIIRYAPTDVPTDGVRKGENLFPFDPSIGPGYVWHCHILPHEDNEMIRPQFIIN